VFEIWLIQIDSEAGVYYCCCGEPAKAKHNRRPDPECCSAKVFTHAF